MAFTQSHHTNGVHAFKTFTATPSNADNGKPAREIVLMPDEEPVYCPSSLSVYSEYELGLMKAPMVTPAANSSSNSCGAAAVTSPSSHDHAPPSYQQYIAQQQQQRQMQQQQQQQQHVSLVSHSLTSPSEPPPVISNSYAEVVFHQRAPVRRPSEYSGSSGASRTMRPPPSPQPRPPIPSHSPNSKLRNNSDSSHGSFFCPISPQAPPPPPPPPHGRPLSGTAVFPRTSPSSCSTSSSSVIPMFASSVPTSAAPCASAPQYFQYNNLNQPPTETKGYMNPSMAFPVSRSRVISRSNDNLVSQSSSNSTTINVNVNQAVQGEPPRLPPQSGVLQRTSGKVVLKPHAFKPVTPRSQSGTTSCSSSPLRIVASPTSPAITSPDATRPVPRPRSQTMRSQDGSSGVSSSCGPGLAPMPELDLSSLENGLDSYPTLKPTPPTPVHCNGATDPITATSVERDLLRQRDCELTTLRRTMEQNEEAMMRVFEERRNELERQLSQERQMVGKMEAALQATSLQLRQAEVRLADSQAQLLQRQPRATPPHAGSRPPSMSSIQKREMGTQACCDMEQLHVLQRELSMRAALFEEERNQWLEEKSKVISYQKQMQLNYVQLCSKTQRLEAEVQHLTLDLERKELQLANMQESGSRS